MDNTVVYEKNLDALLNPDIRIITNQGSTSSSKTWSIDQLLYDIAWEDQGEIISVVSETLPHLKRGAMRDFFTILAMEGQYNPRNHNRTDHTYKVGDSLIEFFSADSYGKVKGARRGYLFVNECNHIPYTVFDQLAVRTKYKIFLDFNPEYEFWLHEHNILDRPDCKFIHSTYLDNIDNLPRGIIQEIESHKNNPDWWRVYGMGLLGSLKGLIYDQFTQIDEMPEKYNWQFYGLDFGYQHPAALIECRVYENNLYVDEIFHEQFLTNPDIVQKFRDNDLARATDIYADSAHADSIEEINREGFNVVGAIKGPQSVLTGIKLVKQFNIYVTKKSLNLIKEFRNYRWKRDRDDRILDEPVKEFDHGLDAIRYAVYMKIGHELKEQYVVYKPKRIHRFGQQ